MAQVLPKMLEAKEGTILFSGATASLRGGARFAQLAAPKFALRALAQSMAREFQPQVSDAPAAAWFITHGCPCPGNFGTRRDNYRSPAIAVRNHHFTPSLVPTSAAGLGYGRVPVKNC